MKTIINYLSMLIFATSIFLGIQFSMKFIKDKKSSITIQTPDSFFTILNHLEIDYLKKEKDLLLELLKVKQMQKISPDTRRLSQKEIAQQRELDRQIEEIQKKVVATDKKIIQTQKEREQAMKQIKEQALTIKQIQKELIRKNEEKQATLVKLEKSEEQIEKLQATNEELTKMNEELSETITQTFQTIYKNDVKKTDKIQELIQHNNFKELIGSEISNLELSMSGNNNEVIEKLTKQHEKEVEKFANELSKQETKLIEVTKENTALTKSLNSSKNEIAEVKKKNALLTNELTKTKTQINSKTTSDASNTKELEEIKSQLTKAQAELNQTKKLLAQTQNQPPQPTLDKEISSFEFIFDKHYKSNAAVYQEFSAAKKDYASRKNPNEYIQKLTQLLNSSIETDKQGLIERDQKNAKNAQEIMKLLKTIDELKK